MDAKVTEHDPTLSEIRSLLEHVAGVGRAADASASAGFRQQGLEVALDITQPLSEPAMLLNAASLVNRVSNEE